MRTREEQAIDMAVAIEGLEKPSELLVKLMREELNEAERRGYERARTECAADTRRLEWLGMQDVVIGYFGGDKWKEVCLARYQRSMPADLADIRITIDAAMEGGK